MKPPKLGKWVSADSVRIVKKNGRRVVEIKRTIKKRKPAKGKKR